MDQRRSPNNSSDARETPPYGLATDPITEPASQEIDEARDEQVEYSVPAPEETYSEPNYALPPMPSVEEDAQPSVSIETQPPIPDGVPRKGHGDKLVTPRFAPPVPTYTPIAPQQPAPYPPQPQVPPTNPATTSTTKLPGYHSYSASTTYGGQAYPQAPAPPFPPQQAAEEAQSPHAAHVDYHNRQPYPYPQQEIYPGVQTEAYLPHPATPITQNLRPARRELPQWAWAAVGAAGMLLIVLAVWVFFLRPGTPTIIGTWRQSAVIPTATSTGNAAIDTFNSIVDRAKCGYADTMQFTQEGNISAESAFGAGGATYQIIENKNLKVTSSAGEYMWTFNLSSDSLAIQGPDGCIEALFTRAK